MRGRFECAVTVFSSDGLRRQNQTPAPRHREAGADFDHAIREGNDAQLMLSVAVEARRTLIGRTTTLAPTWARL